ncbi:MAG: hypothetical protein HC817_06590 [Saprospiraceae bacterium]|nr:hypothetical protein [Saprospiraceae bacterium]
MRKPNISILLTAYFFYAFLSENKTTAQSEKAFRFTRFPKDNQLLPRNPATNRATYSVEGKIAQSAKINSLVLKLSKNAKPLQNFGRTLTFSNDSAAFTISFDLNAELSIYTIELFALNTEGVEVSIKKADNVVVGDVFIVNGQSNCIGSIEDVDYSPWMRSYTAQFGWNDIRYTQPSRWAPRVAREIIDRKKIPVALFNEAYGGVRQEYFLKNTPDQRNNNYLTLLRRLDSAEVRQQVRGIWWWQGESDGWETSPEVFKTQFRQLVSDWQKDYPMASIVKFQIRFRSCGHSRPDVMEAQRQLANEMPALDIMSTNAAQSDSCHFTYKNGYDSLGNRFFRLLSAKLYGGSGVNVRPPDVEAAWFSGKKELNIRFRHVVGDLRIIGNPWADFEIQGSTVKILSGVAEGNTLRLTLSSDTTGVQSVSYKSHISVSEDWITNPLGVGILSFHKVMVSEKPPLTSLNTEGVLDWSLLPTITDAALRIRWERKSVASEKMIFIYNALGIKVLEKKIISDIDESELDVADLAQGYYLVQLVEKGIKRTTKRFLKI